MSYVALSTLPTVSACAWSLVKSASIASAFLYQGGFAEGAASTSHPFQHGGVTEGANVTCSASTSHPLQQGGIIYAGENDDRQIEGEIDEKWYKGSVIRSTVGAAVLKLVGVESPGCEIMNVIGAVKTI